MSARICSVMCSGSHFSFAMFCRPGSLLARSVTYPFHCRSGLSSARNFGGAVCRMASILRAVSLLSTSGSVSSSVGRRILLVCRLESARLFRIRAIILLTLHTDLFAPIYVPFRPSVGFIVAVSVNLFGLLLRSLTDPWTIHVRVTLRLSCATRRLSSYGLTGP